MDVQSSGKWTLQIKAVGDGLHDFAIELDPDADVEQLYDAIYDVTGLRREQQRLIYRGRLLASMDETVTKVRDVPGLTDGHTIHLVRKHEQPEEEAESPQTAPEGSSSNSTTDTPPTETTPASRSSLWSALLGGGERQRRVPFRLREEDLERPDPGSLESVRQGLMTMHTMLPGRGAPKRFSVGQWIDCRDTVNQWLEATVVAIVEPNDVLRNGRDATGTASCQPTYDPAVTATDLEGRRRLLLEPCEEAESEEQIDGVHYRRRSNNSHVQLLHIHYNGWPVRWDEWIRSDSERIRTFRVRTRHPTSSQLSSPTVQATMVSPPNTKLTDTEAKDRDAILPEILFALESVQDLLQQASVQTSHHRVRTDCLPWQSRESRDNEQPKISRRDRQRQLETLAPLVDRLGRTLTDCAPHMAALAASMDEPAESNQLETIEEHPSTLGGLLSLLSRDRRPRNGQSVSSTAAAVQTNDVSVSAASSTTGGLVEEEEIETADPDLSDFVSGIVNTTRGEVRNGPRSNNRASTGEDASNILGAYLAAASLAGGDNTGNGEGTEDNLGRLLRERGTGGIDIHIHAVVTAPGMEGGIGMMTAPTGATAIPIPEIRSQSSRQRRQLPPAPTIPRVVERDDEDEDGIFSDLYTENPEPIDPATPPRPGREPAGTNNTRAEDTTETRRSGSGRSSRRNGVLRFFRREN